jgi:hypothetical protein
MNYEIRLFRVLATVTASSTCGASDTRVADKLKMALTIYEAKYCNVMQRPSHAAGLSTAVK